MVEEIRSGGAGATATVAVAERSRVRAAPALRMMRRSRWTGVGRSVTKRLGALKSGGGSLGGRTPRAAIARESAAGRAKAGGGAPSNDEEGVKVAEILRAGLKGARTTVTVGAGRTPSGAPALPPAAARMVPPHSPTTAIGVGRLVTVSRPPPLWESRA